MGRRPKPAELRLIDGSRARKTMATPRSADTGKPPAGMSEKAQQHWKRLSREWSAVLAPSDRQALWLFCDALAEIDVAIEKVKDEGLYLQSRNGPTISPWGRIIENRREFCRKMLSEFFGTPSARSRFAGSEMDDTAHDEISAKYGL